jgi:hypothetical protein
MAQSAAAARVETPILEFFFRTCQRDSDPVLLFSPVATVKFDDIRVAVVRIDVYF